MTMYICGCGGRAAGEVSRHTVPKLRASGTIPPLRLHVLMVCTGSALRLPICTAVIVLTSTDPASQPTQQEDSYIFEDHFIFSCRTMPVMFRDVAMTYLSVRRNPTVNVIQYGQHRH